MGTVRVLLLTVSLSCLTLTSCQGGEEETFDVSGTVSLVGISKAQVLAADGAAAGDRCQGAGNLADFGGSEEVVVLDADGTKVAAGELEEGTVAANSAGLEALGLSSCELEFTVSDVPVSDGLYTLQIGESETTFTSDEATDIEVTVAGDEYP